MKQARWLRTICIPALFCFYLSSCAIFQSSFIQVKLASKQLEFYRKEIVLWLKMPSSSLYKQRRLVCSVWGGINNVLFPLSWKVFSFDGGLHLRYNMNRNHPNLITNSEAKEQKMISDRGNNFANLNVNANSQKQLNNYNTCRSYKRLKLRPTILHLNFKNRPHYYMQIGCFQEGTI